MSCKCYHTERNFVGKIGVCWGTKEREACSCGGDESKCDFYEDKRKKATPKTTNYALLISKTPEELAEWLCQTQYREGDFCPPKHELQYCIMADGCRMCWLDWLKSPVEGDE